MNVLTGMSYPATDFPSDSLLVIVYARAFSTANATPLSRERLG